MDYRVTAEIDTGSVQLDMTEAQATGLRDRLNRMLAKPEQEPKLGDVVTTDGDGYVYLRTELDKPLWLRLNAWGVIHAMTVKSPTFHFNILDVLKQGELVIALPVGIAERYAQGRNNVCDHTAVIYACRAALEARK